MQYKKITVNSEKQYLSFKGLFLGSAKICMLQNCLSLGSVYLFIFVLLLCNACSYQQVPDHDLEMSKDIRRLITDLSKNDTVHLVDQYGELDSYEFYKIDSLVNNKGSWGINRAPFKSIKLHYRKKNVVRSDSYGWMEFEKNPAWNKTIMRLSFGKFEAQLELDSINMKSASLLNLDTLYFEERSQEADDGNYLGRLYDLPFKPLQKSLTRKPDQSIRDQN
jgi:hypothetical protein